MTQFLCPPVSQGLQKDPVMMESLSFLYLNTEMCYTRFIFLIKSQNFTDCNLTILRNFIFVSKFVKITSAFVFHYTAVQEFLFLLWHEYGWKFLSSSSRRKTNIFIKEKKETSKEYPAESLKIIVVRIKINEIHGSNTWVLCVVSKTFVSS